MSDAVARYINEHGGMGGRELQAKHYDIKSQSPTDAAIGACAAWTQDFRVDAAVPAGSIVDMNAMRTCLGKTGTPAVSAQYRVQSRDSAVNSSPYWVEPVTTSIESMAEVMVEGLFAQGFYTGGRLGLVYDEGPDWTEVVRTVLEPALARRNITIVDRAAIRIRGFSDIAGSPSSLNNAVLSFRQNRVDRVIFLEPWNGWSFFMGAAENQAYRPVYGLTTGAGWQSSYETGLIPDAQIKGAYFVTWSPVLDMPTVKPSSPRRDLCLKIIRNDDIESQGRIAESVNLAACQGLLDLQQLANAANGNLKGKTFAGLFDKISWESAFEPRIQVRRGQQFGVREARPARWNEGCKCFSYTGGPAPIK